MATSRSKTTAARKTAAKTTAKSTVKPTAAKASMASKTADKTTTKAPVEVAEATTATTAPKATPVAADKSLAANTPTPNMVTESKPTVSEPMMRKKELVELVTERSGIKRKYSKPVVDAILAVLGEALADGRELNLHPMGKVKIQRTKQMSNGTVMSARIRQPLKTVESEPKDPLAEAAE